LPCIAAMGVSCAVTGKILNHVEKMAEMDTMNDPANKSIEANESDDICSAP